MSKKRKNPKIYTRQGDSGFTRLMYSSENIPKSDGRIRALAVFELLFSSIAEAWQYQNRCNFALAMKRLRKVGAELGTHQAHMQDFYNSSKYAAIDWEDVKEVEEWIDELQKTTEVTHAFVWADIPEAAKLDTARSFCRLLEVEISHFPVCEETKAYINRLSDYLFIVARYVEQENASYADKWLEGAKVI